MPLLAAFAYAGQFCLGGGGASTNCLSTGIVGTGGATIDWADYIVDNLVQVSLPVRLVTRTGDVVIFNNPNGAAGRLSGEVFALYLHSIIR